MITNTKPGDFIQATIYGHQTRVLVLAVHTFGTIDVQRADGQCFRLTGL